MYGMPACVIPFPDAGKACSDKADCVGLCMAPDNASIGAFSSGACQTDLRDLYGCYNKIEAGVVAEGGCFD